MPKGHDQTSAQVSISEAARLAHVSPRTLRRWEQAGKLTVDRSGPRPRVDVAELLRLGVLDKVGADLGALGAETGQAGRVSASAPRRVDIGESAELAALQAEKVRLEDEVRWLRGRVESLEGAVQQLALPAPELEEASSKGGGAWARGWAWFWGR